MSIPHKLERFLKKHHVYYEVIVHPERFTSSETAEVEHVSGHEFAKAVMVRIQGKDAMAVLPASHRVDLLKLSSLVGSQDIEIENETDFIALFPDCEAGAMPPVGKLYALPCYIDRSLRGAEQICFNAGTHRLSVKVAASDFFRIVKGEVGDFAVPGTRLSPAGV